MAYTQSQLSTGNNKYDISSLQYPNDLLDPKYGGNMVVFHINVNKASKFINTLNESQYIDMEKLDTPSIRSSVVGKPMGVGEMIAVSTAPGAAIGGLLANAFNASKTAIAGAAAGAAGLYATGDIAGTTTRETKRLKSAIALHMPNNLSIRYSAGWSEEDMTLQDMVAQGGEGLIKAVSEQNLSNLSKSLSPIAASLALSNVPGGSYVSAKTGLAPNPKKELVFKGVDFRTFSFDYSFYPRSEAEAINVETIIKTFKFHMHPEYKDAGNFLYVYPSEFDITYYTYEGENTHIHQHTSCVLQELTVNYTPNGSFTTFSNGMPTQINITMTFKELVSPSKETIKEPTSKGGL